MEYKDTIDKNLDEIHNNIQEAAIKSGRTIDDIHLIAVTKTIDIDKIKYIYEKGFKNFGENRVQELREKHIQFGEDINWHLIGHLQRNKVKDIIDKVQLIHSVDSIRLLKEINKQASKINRKMPILIQVNVAEEESKFGIKANEVEAFIKEVSTCDNIAVKGLMTIAPYYENPEMVRPFFIELKKLYDKIKVQEYKNVNMEFLSMGMTNDYMVGIEEGSNMIRVGTGIFGRRHY